MMYALKYAFWGPQTPWLLWHFFPWCKPKSSHDKLDSQS
jgi:hypothetical protein